jgi:hypothetical protein
MPRLMTKEEILKAKSDKGLRDKIKSELEGLVEIGKVRIHSVESPETRTRMSYRVATEDAIIRFCDDLGNYNPLYRSQDQGRDIYGSLVAPPHFLTVISPLAGLAYNELLQSEYIWDVFESGINVEWFKVIRENDEFTITEIPTKVVDLSNHGATPHFLVCAKKIYRNQRDEDVAVVNTSVMMIPAIEFGKLPSVLEKRQPRLRHFSEPQVEQWYHLMLDEPIRGSAPRFWEEVQVSDQLPSYHQCFSTMEHVYLMRGGGYPGAGCWRLQMERSKERIFGWKTVVDSESGLPNFASIHLQDSTAQGYGLPRAVAAGAQMTCWLSNMITNWMGNTGFIKQINHQYRRPLWRDSLVICKAKVTKKYVLGSEHLVDLAYTLEDHNGDFPVPNGIATISLPTLHQIEPEN